MFLFVFASCNTDVVNNQGQGIGNYPDWVCPSWNDNKSLICFGTSEWMDWQGEQGKLLHDYVPDNAISDDYTGKFRLHIDGQNVGIQFNDVDCTVVSMLYNWIGEIYNNWNIPQSDPSNYFEYDCYCKKRGTDPATKSNRAHVKLTRLRDAGFNYFLTVNNKTLINVDMKIPTTYGSLKLNENYSWLKFTLKNNSTKTLYGFSCSENNVSFYSFWALWGIDLFPGNTPVEGDDRIERYIYYCFEGVSLRYIDDEKQTIQLNLLDAAESDFADYFEVVRTGDKAKLTYYKLVDGNPTVVKVYEGLDCANEII